jgi:CRISPR/Cas system CSM-associated protein Csm2 small subunit
MRAVSEYAPLEQRYVTGDMSIRDLATEVGKSWSAIAAWARKHEWKEKRDSYRESVRAKSLQRAADSDVQLAATIRTENINAMRATIYQYVDNLKAKEVHVGVKEASLAIEKLALLLGEATERTESRVVDGTTELPVEDIRELVKLARAHVVSGGVAERS